MTRQLIVVIDKLDQGAIPWYERQFKLEALTADLTKAGVSARVLVGKLEEAPDAWAYLVITDEEEMAARIPQQPALQARLQRALGATHIPQRAAGLAQSLRLLGVVTNMGSWFGSKRDDPKAPNSLFVKRTVAAQLKWELFEVNSSESYASTRPLAMTLPKLIVEYLVAALPADT
ncbi:MAG: hypothetical protein WKG01_13995 [Kofleriaceae bacterium]